MYVGRVILLLMEKYVNRKPDTVVFFCKAISSNVVVEEDIFRNRNCFKINGVHTTIRKTQSRFFCKTKHKVAFNSLYPQVTERLPWYHDDESLGSPISPLHSPTMDHKDSTMVDSVIRNEVGYMARSMFILHSFSLFPVCLFSS